MASKTVFRYIPLENNQIIERAGRSKAEEQKIAEIATQLERSLKILDYWAQNEIQARRSTHARDSVYHGISGIAFAGYYLSQSDRSVRTSDRTETLSHTTATKLSIAEADAKLTGILRNVALIPSEDYFHPNALSFIETPIGLAVMVLARSTQLSNGVNVQASERSRQLTVSVGDDHDSDPHSSVQRITGLRMKSLALLRATFRKTLAMDAQLHQPGNREHVDMEDGCEVLYGRAGLIYGLLYLRKAVKDVNTVAIADPDLRELLSDEMLGLLVDGIIARGKIGAKHFEAENDAMKRRLFVGELICSPPLMWKWHGKRYLGAAHGVAGILQMLLSSPLSTIKHHLPDIAATINWLIDCQEPEGNWPTKAPDVFDVHIQQRSGSAGPNELVHWCHGAPGVLILLSTMLKLCKQEPQLSTIIPDLHSLVQRIQQSLERGGKLVYRRGLLRKGVGLCHGVGGSVYALLAVSDALDQFNTDGSTLGPGSSVWLHYAFELAHLGTSYDRFTETGEMNVPDHPMSLYEGLTGMCCAWSEVLKAMKSGHLRRGMPGYSDVA